MDKVSIIIPVYNVEAYLETCLNSVIGQTYSNLEIIVINDGSKDNCLNIINSYQKKDQRIKLISRSNKGLLASRVEGLKSATGKYIMNVDADDYLETNAVEKLISKSQKNNVDLIRFAFYINDSLEKVTKYNNLYLKKEDFEPTFYDLLFKTCHCNSACGTFFKREKFNFERIINYNISMGEDLEYNLSLYPYIDSLLFIDEAYYHYRVNNNSITRKMSSQSIMKNITSASYAYTNLYNAVELFNITNKAYYMKLAATRLITEIYFLELKLLFLMKKEPNIIIFINQMNDSFIKNDIKSKTNLKLMVKNARRHKFYIALMFKNNIFLAKLYAKIVYGSVLRLRRIKNG